ncbi:MAG: hypothetical protein INR64_16570 [Caulobacteraceae bacterium]|nr:hypothetical protein [Caulobacter sp.]
MALIQSICAFTEPEIAARARTAVLAAAGVGAAVVVLRAALPRRTPARAVLSPALRDGFAYLLLGLAVRFAVQHHRSRLQIVVLLTVVALVEAARFRRGAAQPRAATWLAGSVAVCLGVVAAKWALEPGALTDALGRLAGRGDA